MTGQWVAVVNEDWRWRMVTPPVGDTASLPLNERGRAAAAAWDLERDKAEGNLCKAFAGPGLSGNPRASGSTGRMADSLRLEFDAGRQVRLFEFAPGPSAERSLRDTPKRSGFVGRSRAACSASAHRQRRIARRAHDAARGGYLRPNGVPFSERATVKEFFSTFTLPGDAGAWLIVTTVVTDPEYLTTELVISRSSRRNRHVRIRGPVTSHRRVLRSEPQLLP